MSETLVLHEPPVADGDIPPDAVPGIPQPAVHFAVPVHIAGPVPRRLEVVDCLVIAPVPAVHHAVPGCLVLGGHGAEARVRRPADGVVLPLRCRRPARKRRCHGFGLLPPVFVLLRLGAVGHDVGPLQGLRNLCRSRYPGCRLPGQILLDQILVPRRRIVGHRRCLDGLAGPEFRPLRRFQRIGESPFVHRVLIRRRSFDCHRMLLLLCHCRLLPE